MLVEIIALSVSVIVLFALYFARVKSRKGGTFLFSERFLNRADDGIFDLIKFVYKMYDLLFHNIAAFIRQIPHKIATVVHRISHAIATYAHEWVEKLTHMNSHHK